MKATKVHAGEDSFLVEIEDGSYFRVPWNVSRKLMDADEIDRDMIELLGQGRGIYWPLVDEDLRVDQLRQTYGRHYRK